MSKYKFNSRINAMNKPEIITLTTDFGLTDTYVGTLKGVLLSINPRCSIVDITHDIAPQNIMGGAFALRAACGYFPEGTVHLAVVDPGVGSSRRPVIVETEKYFFVGPDNGIFSFFLSGEEAKSVHEITDPSYFLPSPGSTFHGRDIFAPAAAHLSKGTPAACFGGMAKDPVKLKIPEPIITGDKEAEGEIIHIDRFGNLVTNLSHTLLASLSAAGAVQAEVRGRPVRRLLSTYSEAEAGELFCLTGSSGFMEISVRNKSARDATGAAKGDRVRLKVRI